MTDTHICIQTNDFNLGDEYNTLAVGNKAGAIVTFVGRVRDYCNNQDQTLWLEHYPAMTESVLQDITEQARERWPILGVRIIHRVGKLLPGEQIVFVGVSSKHRKAAFNACEFIMDYLKTQAPFWKKEGQQWVDAKTSDEDAAAQWTKTAEQPSK